MQSGFLLENTLQLLASGLLRFKRSKKNHGCAVEVMTFPISPHTIYYQGGYAIHGAHWYNKFGTPVSHGCINLAPNHAKWIFEWADIGTPVLIQFSNR
jgi:hypothetical protein